MGYIDVNSISYSLSDSTRIFSELSFGLDKEKTGLIGANGVGKTTLLKILVKELNPSQGYLKVGENIAYLPQDFRLDSDKTIGEFLAEPDFKILKYFHLSDIDLNRELLQLSGGEKMKIALAKIMSFDPEFLILDEPTSNLDEESRQIVLKMIKDWKKGLLVVSHDRELLNLMERIFELTAKGLKIYGGNYDDYIKQKEMEEEAVKRRFVSAKQNFAKVEKQAKETKEKQQKKANKGKKDRQKIGMPKSVLNLMRDTAQSTASRLINSHEKVVASAKEKVESIKKQILPENEIVIKLPKTEVPTGKMVIKITNMAFSYSQKNIFQNFNLVVYGPERLVVKGKNGSGKTTLAKLLTGELQPGGGEIKIGVENIAYLDQNTNILDEEKTLLENMSSFAKVTENNAKEILAKFLFRGIDVYKKTKVLSGGEKMRMALACVLSKTKPPQLLILDEPTNNLDIDSIQKLESALNNYQGALLVISHDKRFIENIDVKREVKI